MSDRMELEQLHDQGGELATTGHPLGDLRRLSAVPVDLSRRRGPLEPAHEALLGGDLEIDLVLAPRHHAVGMRQATAIGVVEGVLRDVGVAQHGRA